MDGECLANGRYQECPVNGEETAPGYQILLRNSQGDKNTLIRFGKEDDEFFQWYDRGFWSKHHWTGNHVSLSMGHSRHRYLARVLH